MNASSVGQSRCQKMRSNIKSNVSEDSADKDKYLERIGQREVMKYLKKKLLPPY